MIADRAIQYGGSCGGKILADEGEVIEITLVQVCTDELEDIEVEAVSGDHDSNPEFRLVADND